MNKSLYEQTGGTYEQNVDYILPNLELPQQKAESIGIWGQRHKQYLKSHHKVLYYNYLTSDKLNTYLAGIDKQAEDMFLRLVKELAEKENVTEKLKAEHQILWVQRMNSIRNRAMEIINAEVIFTR